MRYFYCLVSHSWSRFWGYVSYLSREALLRSGHYPPPPPLALCARSHHTLRVLLACSMLPTQLRSQGPLLLNPRVREDLGNEVGSPLSLYRNNVVMLCCTKNRCCMRIVPCNINLWIKVMFHGTICNNGASTTQRCNAGTML